MFWHKRKQLLQRLVTLRQLTSEGDSTKTVAVATLEKDLKENKLVTVVNGKAVKDWDELLTEIQKSEDPQVLQIPKVVGG